MRWPFSCVRRRPILCCRCAFRSSLGIETCAQGLLSLSGYSIYAPAIEIPYRPDDMPSFSFCTGSQDFERIEGNSCPVAYCAYLFNLKITILSEKRENPLLGPRLNMCRIVIKVKRAIKLFSLKAE